MKCKYCNGTGYNDTQRGTVMTEFPPCPWCGGSGYVRDNEQTNEEYIRSCSTEELAEFLHWLTLACYICGKDGVREDKKHCIFGRCTGHEDIKEWLKEKHKNG